MANQLPSFDVLMDLAQNNPEQLEDIRNLLSKEIIQDASPRIRHKLEGIIFKVDMERQRSKTPLQSCIRIAALMHDSFNQMREELDTLFQPSMLKEAHYHPKVPKCTLPPQVSASNVIPFKRTDPAPPH